MEQYFIYFPERELVTTPDRYGLAFEDVTVETQDGVRLHGWYLPASDDKPLVLFFHGNAGNISHRIDNLVRLQRLGLGVLIFDYRGYGRSGGEPSESGLAEDARAAQTWLQGRGWPAARTLYFGRSLGAAVALQLALERPPLGLVLETPFTSIRELGAVHYPLVSRLFGWLLKDRYDNLAKISGLKSPLLIFQGDRDSVVPLKMAQRLYRSAPEPKAFHLIRGADHNDTYEVGGEAYWQTWREFLQGETPGRISP